MVTCSYLCQQQRIRRQGCSDPSYCNSRSDIPMHCDQAAVRTNSTRDGAFEQSVTTFWEAGANCEGAGNFFDYLRGQACRSERRGAAELLNNHTTLHHTKQPAPNSPLLTNCTYRQQHISLFASVHFSWLLRRRATWSKTEGHKTRQKLSQQISKEDVPT